MFQAFPASHFQQRGAILVIGLILLLVMTLIGLSAARGTLLEERMSGRNTDNRMAFQAAEAALRAAEQSLQLPVLLAFDDTNGRYKALEYHHPEQAPLWKQWADADEDSHWNRNAIGYESLNEAAPRLNQPSARYYIEEFPRAPGAGESLAADAPIDELGLYRITARGLGISGTNSVILQSTYKR